MATLPSLPRPHERQTNQGLFSLSIAECEYASGVLPVLGAAYHLHISEVTRRQWLDVLEPIIAFSKVTNPAFAAARYLGL